MFDNKVDTVKTYGSKKVGAYKPIKKYDCISTKNKKNKSTRKRKPPVLAMTKWWKDKLIQEDLKRLY